MTNQTFSLKNIVSNVENYYQKINVFFLLKGNLKWLQLTPFFISSVMYFVLYSFDFFDSVFLRMFLKMLPTICLTGVMLMSGIKFINEHLYRQLILIAFIISCPADALLEDENSFVYGILGYMIVHMIFITGFGWKPLKPKLGIFFLVCTINGDYIFAQVYGIF